VSAVRLRFLAETPLPVDAAGLLPELLAGKDERTLAALPLRVGNRTVPLGELAEIHPGEDEALVIEGAFAALDRLGHRMTRGRIEVYGDVGDYLGQEMQGGRIELFGSAGAHAATGMRGGLIHIQANAGDFLGAALPGARFGMRDGTVLVSGDAGDRVGDRMRRGLIAVIGRLGDGAAGRMIGGTILGLDGCGADPGYAMRRGTLLLGREPTSLLPTFADNGRHRLPWLNLLVRHLAGLEPPVDLPGDRVARWTGCASAGGKGEILILS
jgi:formylmethanofuran dehydrogenase subunit C